MKRAVIICIFMIVFIFYGCSSGKFDPSVDKKPTAGIQAVSEPEGETGILKEPIPSLTKGNYNYNIKFLSDGAFTVDNLPGIPKIYQDVNRGSYRYGYIESDPIEIKNRFKSIVFKLDGVERLKNGRLLLEARGSTDKNNWSEFKTAVEIDGDKKNENEIIFNSLSDIKFIQYRVNIICNSRNKPIIEKISLGLRGMVKV